MGHFPQSFEWASIGGFAAARSSGQASAGYGRFDEMVVRLTLATAHGTLTAGDVVVTENPAIQWFLARTFPEQRLLPAGGLALEADVISTLAWLSNGITPPIGPWCSAGEGRRATRGRSASSPACSRPAWT